MTTSHDLTLTGSTVNGTLSSFCTVLTCQPLSMVKNSIMTGKGLPGLNRGLYRGYPVNACCDMINQSIGFLANNFFAKVIMQSKPLTPGEHDLGGVFSGMVPAPLYSFCERIMIVQQVNKENPVTKKAYTIAQVVREILRLEGAKGIVRGLIPTIMRESTNFACFFGLQKSIQSETEKWIKNKHAAASVAFLISGCFAGMVTTPADLIKTNMQATLGDPSSFLKVANKLIKQNGRGAMGLFHGCLPRTMMIGSLMTTMGFFSSNIPRILPESLHTKKAI